MMDTKSCQVLLALIYIDIQFEVYGVLPLLTDYCVGVAYLKLSKCSSVLYSSIKGVAEEC